MLESYNSMNNETNYLQLASNATHHKNMYQHTLTQKKHIYIFLINLVPLDNNRAISTCQPERRRIGTRLVRAPPRVGDVLAGGAPAAGETCTRARAVVAGTSPGAFHVAQVAAEAALRVTCIIYYYDAYLLCGYMTGWCLCTRKWPPVL